MDDVVPPGDEDLVIAPGSTMAPALGHARVFTSEPSEENSGKLMLTFKDYPTGPGFTYAKLRELVAEDFDCFILSIHLTNEEGTSYSPDTEVSPGDSICTNAALALDDRHFFIWTCAEMVLGSLASIPSQLLELPLDAVLFHRLYHLFTTGAAPSLFPLIARMWREHGLSAFFHTGFYLGFAAFVRDFLSRSLTASLFIALPLNSVVFAFFTTPSVHVLARGPPPGASLLSAFFHQPPFPKSISLLSRLPSVCRLIIPRDMLSILFYIVSPRLCRFVVSDEWVSFASHMLRSVVTHPIKLVEKRIILNETAISIPEAWRHVWSCPTWLFLDSLCVNIALRVFIFKLQPMFRTVINKRIGKLVRRMDDQSAVRRLAAEVVIGFSVPVLFSATYVFWWRKT